MQEDLAKARVILRENVPTEFVGIGSRVRLVRLDDGAPLVLSLLGPWDTDLEKHVYSYQTPLAAGLLGRKVDEEVDLKIAGQDGRYRIDHIESALSPPVGATATLLSPCDSPVPPRLSEPSRAPRRPSYAPDSVVNFAAPADGLNAALPTYRPRPRPCARTAPQIRSPQTQPPAERGLKPG